MTLKFEPYEPQSKCGVPRGKSKHAHCEYPPDHIIGGFDQPMDHHFGRSRSGRWYSWPDGGRGGVKPDEYTYTPTEVAT